MSGSRYRRGDAPEFTTRLAVEPAQQPAQSGAYIAAQQMDRIGDRILNLAERQQRRLDQAAEQEAIDAGAAAGDAAPGTIMEGGGQLYRAAYNRAAMESGARRLEITANQEVARLAREHQADPAAFERAFTAWRDGAIAAMPEAFRPRAQPLLDSVAMRVLPVIRDAQDRAVADERGATFAAVLPDRLAAIERHGLRMASDPAARADADREQARLHSDLISLGPRHAFEFEGVQYPADPTRAGRYTLQQMAEIRGRARDTEILAVGRGMFQAGPQTPEWIENFERQVERGEIPGLRPDQGRALADAFRRDLAQARAATTEAQRAARAELAPRLDADKAAIAESGAPVSNILDHELERAGINVQQYRAQERARMAGWQARQDLQNADTPERAQELADRFAPGTPLFMADPETAARVLQEARRRGATIRGAELQDRIRDRSAELTANAAAAAAPFSMDRALQMLERTESGGRASIGDHDGAGPGTASGLLGITAGMWRDWAARAGVADRDRNDPEAQRRVARVFLEAQDAWARQNLGRGLTYTDVRGAWFLGEAGWKAMVQAPPGADAFEVYSRAAGAGRAAQAFDNPRNRQVLQRGRTAGEVMAALAAQAGEGAWRPGARLPPIVSAEEAIAAGQTPEWAARVSAEAAEAARQAALRVRAQTATPQERQEIEAELAITGERAAENARLIAAWREALDQRAQAMAQDPAGYVTQTSPTLQALEQRVAQGDAAALPALIDGLAREQERQGVPQQQRRILSNRLTAALFDSVASAATPEQGMERLRALSASMGQGPLVEMMRQARMSGPDQDGRRDMLLVAAAKVASQEGVSQQILRGMAVLQNTPPANLPAPRVQADADAVFGQAFAASPGARDAAVAAARAIYAAEMSAAGTLGAAYDSSRMRAAMDRVVPTTSWNGYRVPVPSGMDAATFRRTLDRLPPTVMEDAGAIDGRRFTAEMLQHGAAQLLAVGDGRYQVLYAGMAVMSASRPGQPFILDMRGVAPLPPAPTGRDLLAQGAGATRGVRRIEGWDEPDPEPAAPAASIPSRVRQNWEGGRSAISNAPIGARLRGEAP